MTDINDDDISCEYCNIGFTGLYLRAIQQKVFNTKDGHLDLHCVWRKIPDKSDGCSLDKVWCCEYCYIDPGRGQIVYETKQMRLKLTVATVDAEQMNRQKWIEDYNNSLPQKVINGEFGEMTIAIGGIYDGEAELYEFDNHPSPRIIAELEKNKKR